ncbi:MAG: 3-oxoacyl-[acyl-carrier-protein] reductase [Rickettsiales bacterium]
MFNLKGKKALVTGSTGGIGKDIAKALVEQGAVVTLSGTNEEKLKKLKSDISPTAHIISCDLRDSEAVVSLVEKSNEMMSGLDIVVCNAGITKDNLIMRMKNEDFEDVIKVNLQSSFIINKSAVKIMMKNRWGRIINISSVVGVSGNPGQANYCASKAGMIGMSKSIAIECATRNITVNCIAPGFIETPMTDALNEDQKEKILSGIPAKRMGQSTDIASTAVFLASEEAGYITGQTLHVNGGLLMV